MTSTLTRSLLQPKLWTKGEKSVRSGPGQDARGRRPKVPIPGIDLAGRVETVGPGVTQFRPGDDVYGECVRGIQWKNGGAFAEYASVLAKDLATMPERLTYVEAAAVPTSGLIALQTVRDEGHLQSGQRVLINGAGGAVGSFAVQLAKAYGGEVTAVDAGQARSTALVGSRPHHRLLTHRLHHHRGEVRPDHRHPR